MRNDLTTILNEAQKEGLSNDDIVKMQVLYLEYNAGLPLEGNGWF